MSKARGRVEEVDLLQIAGLDSRVWQKDGSSTDNSGIVFSLKGQVAKVAGIQPLVEWAMSDQLGLDLESSPFWDSMTGKLFPLMSIGSFNRAGAIEILLEYGGILSVLSGDTVRVLATGRQAATRPSEGTQFLQVGGAVLIMNGVDQNMKWDGRHLTPLGIQFPPPAPICDNWPDGHMGSKIPFSIQTIHAYAGSGINKTAQDLTNKYRYKLTYLNNQGTESGGSSPSNALSDRAIPGPTGNDTTFWVMVSNLQSGTGRPDIVSRRLYREGPDAQAYYLLAELQGVGSFNYIDDSSITYPLDTSSAFQLPPDGYNSPPPLSKMAMFLRGITFYAGDPEAPRTLYYSVGNGLKETVPRPGNSAQITTEDGSDYITAMTVASDYGLVFTERSIHMVSLDKDGDPVITPVSQNVGSVGTRAVTNFEGKVYFFSHDGVFMFDGTTPRPLSNELNQQVKDLPTVFLSDIVGFPDPDGRRVCFSVCSGYGAENNEIWAIHVDTGAVSKIKASVFDAMRYKGETLVSFARDHVGLILTGESDPPEHCAEEERFPEHGEFRLTDLGMWGCLNNIAETDQIISFFDTRWLIGKNPESDKTFYRVDVFYSQTGSYDLDLQWYTDWENDPVGQTTVHMQDTTATSWGEDVGGEGDQGTPLIQKRTWNDTNYANNFAPNYPGKWDSERVRSVRVDLGTSLISRSPSLEDQSEGLTAKSIKFRFGTEEERLVSHSLAGDSAFFLPKVQATNENWKIVGLVLFYSDHGVRAEGTDFLEDPE